MKVGPTSRVVINQQSSILIGVVLGVKNPGCRLKIPILESLDSFVQFASHEKITHTGAVGS